MLKKIVIALPILIVICASLYAYSTYYPFISKRLVWRDLDGMNNISAERSPAKALQNDFRIRLALFTQIDKERPLFGGPGLDVSALDEAVTSLGESQNSLKKILGLTDDFYPMAFLRKVVGVNKLAAKFENDKSVSNANELLKAEKETAVAYKTYTVFLRTKLAKTKLPTGLFEQSGGITSRDIILSDLDKTISNADSLAGEVSMRSACLNYSTIFCNRNKLVAFYDYSSQTPIAPTEIFPSHETISGQTITAGGPYQIVTPCWRKSVSSANVLLLYALETDGGKSLSTQLADNIYFEKLSAEQFGLDLYNQYVADGVEWDVSSIDSGYTCNNMEYQPSLATINSYYNKYAKAPLFGEKMNQDWPQQLMDKIKLSASLESAFASEKYPSEMTLDKLAQSYADVYNQIVQSENDGSVGKSNLEDIKSNVLFRFNFINDKMAGYNEILSFLSFRTSTHSLMSELNPKGQTEMDYVYFMRNAYGITLGGFSPSVWVGSKRLQYLDQNTKINPRLVGYDDLVKQYSVEYVNKVISTTRDFVVSQLRKAAGL